MPRMPFYPHDDINMPPVPHILDWTDYTPVIPKLYWDVYSQEERIKKLCIEYDRLCAYANFLADNINDVYNELDTINSTIATIQSTIKTIQSDITSIKNTISTIQSTIKTIQNDISTINATITTMQRDITKAKQDIIANATDIAELQNFEQNMTKWQSTINTWKTAVDRDVDLIQSQITTIFSDIATIENWQAGIDKWKTSTNTTLDTLSNKFPVTLDNIADSAKNGAVANGDNRLVTGDVVYKALTQDIDVKKAPLNVRVYGEFIADDNSLSLLQRAKFTQTKISESDNFLSNFGDILASEITANTGEYTNYDYIVITGGLRTYVHTWAQTNGIANLINSTLVTNGGFAHLNKEFIKIYNALCTITNNYNMPKLVYIPDFTTCTDYVTDVTANAFNVQGIMCQIMKNNAYFQKSGDTEQSLCFRTVKFLQNYDFTTYNANLFNTDNSLKTTSYAYKIACNRAISIALDLVDDITTNRTFVSSIPSASTDPSYNAIMNVEYSIYGDYFNVFFVEKTITFSKTMTFEYGKLYNQQLSTITKYQSIIFVLRKMLQVLAQSMTRDVSSENNKCFRINALIDGGSLENVTPCIIRLYLNNLSNLTTYSYSDITENLYIDIYTSTDNTFTASAITLL